jgi:hypothetical protein
LSPRRRAVSGTDRSPERCSSDHSSSLVFRQCGDGAGENAKVIPQLRGALGATLFGISKQALQVEFYVAKVAARCILEAMVTPRLGESL